MPIQNVHIFAKTGPVNSFSHTVSSILPREINEWLQKLPQETQILNLTTAIEVTPQGQFYVYLTVFYEE